MRTFPPQLITITLLQLKLLSCYWTLPYVTFPSIDFYTDLEFKALLCVHCTKYTSKGIMRRVRLSTGFISETTRIDERNLVEISCYNIFNQCFSEWRLKVRIFTITGGHFTSALVLLNLRTCAPWSHLRGRTVKFVYGPCFMWSMKWTL